MSTYVYTYVYSVVQRPVSASFGVTAFLRREKTTDDDCFFGSLCLCAGEHKSTVSLVDRLPVGVPYLISYS